MKTNLFVSSIESFATKDGEGIRSAVFFQGCPLRCAYCHNPETWQFGRGEEWEASTLVEKIKRFKPYYGEKGGVTLSGGEPLMQAKNLISFCKLLKAENINISLDTSGAVLNKDVENLVRLVDHIILDLKFNSEENYKKFCGGSLEQTLKFLTLCNSFNKRIWIRIVVVPGINDNENAIKKYLNILKNYSFEKIELLPFHTLGFSKYEKYNIENKLIQTNPMSPEKLENLQKIVKKFVF